MKNGSKLLWSLLIQGAVIGSVVAYQKLKGDKNPEDFSANIDDLEKKDHKRAEKTDNSTEAKDTPKENPINEFFKEVNTFREVVKESGNLIDDLIGVISKHKNEPQESKTQAKQDPVKPPAPSEVKTPEKTEVKQEQVKPVQEKKTSTPEAKSEKPAHVSKPKEAEAPASTEKQKNVKSVAQINEDLFNRINSYSGKDSSAEATQPVAKKEASVVPKNKVNLPKPETKTSTPKEKPGQDGQDSKLKPKPKPKKNTTKAKPATAKKPEGSDTK